MHATLYVGASNALRQQAATKQLDSWDISVIDIVSIDQISEHITIDQIREFCKKLYMSPAQSQYHVGIIKNAGAMTIEAQNALLKMLEEPPPCVQILLETQNAETLLATVLSRCQVIRVTGEHEENEHIPLFALLDAPVGERLFLLEKYSPDRVTAKKFVNDALQTGEKLLYTEKEKTRITTLLRKLLRAQAQLESNCNPKLVLDRVFL